MKIVWRLKWNHLRKPKKIKGSQSTKHYEASRAGRRSITVEKFCRAMTVDPVAMLGTWGSWQRQDLGGWMLVEGCRSLCKDPNVMSNCRVFFQKRMLFLICLSYCTTDSRETLLLAPAFCAEHADCRRLGFATCDPYCLEITMKYIVCLNNHCAICSRWIDMWFDLRTFGWAVGSGSRFGRWKGIVP